MTKILLFTGVILGLVTMEWWRRILNRKKATLSKIVPALDGGLEDKESYRKGYLPD